MVITVYTVMNTVLYIALPYTAHFTLSHCTALYTSPQTELYSVHLPCRKPFS